MSRKSSQLYKAALEGLKDDYLCDISLAGMKEGKQE